MLVLVAIGLFAIWNVAICPDCVWMNIFHCFVFGIIAISRARVNYVCHNNNNNNNNNNICLFQTHKIGTANICRSIHIEIQTFNTRQSIWRAVHNNDNITCMTVMLSYYVMMHVQWFYPVPPNARGPSNVWDKNCGYYRISRQVKSCHKSKDHVTNDSFTIWDSNIPQTNQMHYRIVIV